MNMMVAVDKQWAIGKNGQLLVRIPNDQKLFRQETLGKVVVYGRKTLNTFPGKLPLEGRQNFVLSRNPAFSIKGAQAVHSLTELCRALKPYDTKDVYVIGGGEVYAQLLPYCDIVHVTKIDHIYDADTYFPDLEKASEWAVTAESEEQYYFDLAYYFLRYERKGGAKNMP